jgi:trehalose 6-phosphate synthase/phosphatase
VDEYQMIRERIEQLVGQDQRCSCPAGVDPVRYLYRSLPVEELVAFYRAADVMLVTPCGTG